jgi:hypothetical protein
MKNKDGKPKRIENTIIEKWTKPDKLTLLSGWARDGYTNKEIAEKIGISVPVFRSWCAKKPEIDQAVRDGKEIVDYKVEEALMRAATGGQTIELNVTVVYDKDQQVINTIKKRTTRQHPPNVLACQTWLFNRQRDKWKRNRDNEITVEDDKSINITIKRAAKKIEVEEADE